MAHILKVQVQILLSITRIAVQVLLLACHNSRCRESYRQQWRGRDIGITNLSWQQEQQEQISKNMTTQTTFIVRVGYSFSLFSVSVKRSSV
jgi:hypothetical protein